jgi:hypothetical protein
MIPQDNNVLFIEESVGKGAGEGGWYFVCEKLSIPAVYVSYVECLYITDGIL